MLNKGVFALSARRLFCPLYYPFSPREHPIQHPIMSGTAPKRKGTSFERELVAAARAAGLQAERAWSSDGRTLRTSDGKPCTGDVDILINGRLKLQAKRRKAIAGFMKPPAGAHVAVIREDRGQALAVLPMDLFIRLLSKVYNPNNEV